MILQGFVWILEKGYFLCPFFFSIPHVINVRRIKLRKLQKHE